MVLWASRQQLCDERPGQEGAPRLTGPGWALSRAQPCGDIKGCGWFTFPSPALWLQLGGGGRSGWACWGADLRLPRCLCLPPRPSQVDRQRKGQSLERLPWSTF